MNSLVTQTLLAVSGTALLATGQVASAIVCAVGACVISAMRYETQKRGDRR